ncbi:hypothetical protein M9H77_22762 [Catharanthus roseus]|uniref:Uncharacterized protein n=1 Tax=Catharanthus roseus TaxID=4058 RepID=A0ACC0ASB4_CATRO|nr:hypothetical protein M9H77_22762 [Catharanthus roseus]
MEEVPAHVHPSPIVPDIFTRQHEHRSGLIWNISVAIYSSVIVPLHVKKEPLEAWILREITGSGTDDDLILRVRGFIFLLLGGHMLFDFSRSLVHVLKKAKVLPLKALVELIFNKLVRYFHQYREEAQNCVHPFPT